MTSNFRKIAFRLIFLAMITATVTGVYLWYNFNAKSKLILLLPDQSQWFVHFQTKEVKKALGKEKPDFVDSLSALLPRLPVFNNVKDPGDIGLALLSDVLVCGTPQGMAIWFNATSEPRLKRFVNELIPKGMVTPYIDKESYGYVRGKQKPLYFAFKEKAACLLIPLDSAIDPISAEKWMKELFTPPKRNPMQIEDIKQLYKNNQLVAYEFGNEKGAQMGVNLSNPIAKFVSLQKQPTSPLWLLYKGGMKYSPEQVNHLVTKNNEITSVEFVNECLALVYYHLKPFEQ